VSESRVLDFDIVIVTSMNEGKLPENRESVIPYDVHEECLLHIQKRDAIYTVLDVISTC
jgi:hypothetical protein